MQKEIRRLRAVVREQAKEIEQLRQEIEQLRRRTIHDLADDDEALTIVEASARLGITSQAVGGRLDRGTLTTYIDPEAPARQGRRLISRREVEALK